MPGEHTAYPTAAGFDVVRRGYEPDQVDGHLHRVDTELRILGHDRDAAVDQAVQLQRELEAARVRTEKLRAQVRSLAVPPHDAQTMSERLRSMLHLAQDEVADMRARARDETDRLRSETEHEATQMLTSARAEADALLGEARRAAEQTRTAAREQADAVIGEANEDARLLHEEIERCRAATRAEQDAAGADLAAAATAAARDRAERGAEAERRRAEVEQDFTIAMDQRRSEALTQLHRDREAAHAEVTGMRATATAEARQLVAVARTQTAELLSVARDRLEQLAALRERIVGQLGSAAVELSRVRADLESEPAGIPHPAPAAEADRPSPSPRDRADDGGTATVRS